MKIKITREWARHTGQTKRLEDVALKDAHAALVVSGAASQALYDSAVEQAMAGRACLLQTKDARFYFEPKAAATIVAKPSVVRDYA